LAEILHLDLTTCKVEDFAEFSSDFEFEVNCDCKITAIGKDNFWNYLSCTSVGQNLFWAGPIIFGQDQNFWTLFKKQNSVMKTHFWSGSKLLLGSYYKTSTYKCYRSGF
jgi:hypothetical protein